jgi:hypothetical protein
MKPRRRSTGLLVSCIVSCVFDIFHKKKKKKSQKRTLFNAMLSALRKERKKGIGISISCQEKILN